MAPAVDYFSMQRSVRRPWRRYVDQLTEHRAVLHSYCCRLTGNVWDGEGLVQDTLMRVFSLLGKTDAATSSIGGRLCQRAARAEAEMAASHGTDGEVREM